MTARRPAFPVLALLSLLGGCDEPPAPAPPPPPRPPPPAPIVAARSVTSAAAFDLIVTTEGPLLVWGAPARSGGGVNALRLGPRGEALDHERAVVNAAPAESQATHAVEVEAASSGRAVGVAWVSDTGGDVSVGAAFSPNGGRRFRRALRLGSTPRLPLGDRGRISLAASDTEQIVVRHRREDGRCVRYANRGRCAFIARTTFSNRPSRDNARDHSATEVPRPCAPFVMGSLFRDGSWFFGLCNGDPSPTAHVLVVDPDPQLATPTDIAPGCHPLGMAPAVDGVAVLTLCDGDRLAVNVLSPQGQVRRVLPSVRRSVHCQEGRPVLTLAATQGDDQLVLPLGPATSRLESLLPEPLTTGTARAVWTGEALLVAAPIGPRDVSVRRYECGDDGTIERTDAL